MRSFGVGYGCVKIPSTELLFVDVQQKHKSSLIAVALVIILAMTSCVGTASAPLVEEQQPLSAEVIASACNSLTQFSEVCIASLVSGDRTVKPGLAGLEIAKLATHKALVGVNYTYSLSMRAHEKLPKEKVRGKAVLRDCAELTESCRDEVEQALDNLGDLTGDFSAAQINDIRTWLSTSLTFLTTCTDELHLTEEAGPLVRLKDEGAYVEKLISNALAFSTSLLPLASGVFPGLVSESAEEEEWAFPLSNRRSLRSKNHHASKSDDAQNIFAAWMSDKDAELLQAITPTPDVTVAWDGSAKYKTVQAAVNAAPKKSSKRYVIYIKRGTYEEQVIIPKNTGTSLMFIGDGIGKTVITGNRNVKQPDVTTYNSATVIVEGAGFTARDITFRNTAGAANGQAVALRVSADHAAFYKCSMEGYQDTLYVHSGRQFYRDCTITGTVDFIFGNAAAVFQSCSILARVPGERQMNMITAQGRTDKNQNTGLSLHSCTVDGTSDLQKASSQYPTYLGRPWKNYSRTVLMKCYEGSVVNPAGWYPWDGEFALKTLYYGEYLCTGPGAGASQRVPWSTQITSSSVADKFTVTSFIQGPDWLPETSFPFQAGL